VNNVMNREGSVYHTQLHTSVTVSHLSPLHSFIPVELELASLSLGVSSVDVCSLVPSRIDTSAPSLLPVSITNQLMQLKLHTTQVIRYA
jgi:hypothetical protein